MKREFLVRLFIVSTLLCLVSVIAAGDTAVSPDRKVLWESFHKDCPPQYLPVEVYAENDSFTTICYRSKSKTFLYSLKDRAVSEAKHAKQVGAVNRISYEAQEKAFILWHNGIEQLKIYHSF